MTATSIKWTRWSPLDTAGKCQPDKLAEPLRWRKPRLVEVCPDGDLFGDEVGDKEISAVFGVMAACPQHTFLVLAKRTERLPKWFAWISYLVGDGEIPPLACDPLAGCEIQASRRVKLPVRRVGTGHCSPSWPLPNLLLGVHFETQADADARLPHLLQCPAAALRWAHVVPREGIDLSKDETGFYCNACGKVTQGVNGGDCAACGDVRTRTRCYIDNLDWVRIAGETGRNARPMHPQWVRSLRDQCVAAGVPFWFDGWGEWVPDSHPKDADEIVRECLQEPGGIWLGPGGETTHENWETVHMLKVGKRAAGRILDGRTWDELPEASKGR